MSKPQSPRWVGGNEAFATARNIKGSVQKAQLVLDLIRGQKVEKALNDLSFSRKKLAVAARKVLQSAIANAEQNHQLNVDQLVVAHAYADKFGVLKRFTARARGRGARILKPFCSITVVVAEKAEQPKAAKPKAEKAVAKASKPAAKAETATTEKTEA